MATFACPRRTNDTMLISAGVKPSASPKSGTLISPSKGRNVNTAYSSDPIRRVWTSRSSGEIGTDRFADLFPDEEPGELDGYERNGKGPPPPNRRRAAQAEPCLARPASASGRSAPAPRGPPLASARPHRREPSALVAPAIPRQTSYCECPASTSTFASVGAKRLFNRNLPRVRSFWHGGSSCPDNRIARSDRRAVG